MAGWKKRLLSAAVNVEEQFDRLRLELSARLGLGRPLIIEPYVGYGTPHVATLKGRVLQNKRMQPATDEDTLWRNVLNAYRRLESDEVAGATVQGTLHGRSETAVTDKEGYFDLTFTFPQPLPPHEPWHDVSLTLRDAPLEFDPHVVQNGRILIPPADAAFGVISDIDDTVLQSSATNYLHAARLLLLHNARTRLPFTGVAAFYRALQQGANGRSHNPIFYVSSSPWNVFTLLHDFFAHQQIPPGPLFLKDYGLSADQFISKGHRAHKITQIETLLRTYPHLPFVLIGDSGQKDPEIYAEIVQRHPGRIKAIYIRDVTTTRRDRQVLALARRVKDAGVEMLLTADSAAAAAHAAQTGLIDPAALPAIVENQAEDASGLPLDELAT